MELRNKLNILFIAYSCRPHKGSEPGVGWNVVIESSKIHNVYVFTHISNKEDIDKETLKNNFQDIIFYYFKLPLAFSFIHKYFGMRMDYFFWNIFSINYLTYLDFNCDFDIIHHITFNQYRTINFGFFTNKPFVFGPIGGADYIKGYFFKDLNFLTALKEIYRKSKIDIWFFNLFFKLNTNKKIILYSSIENCKNLNFKSKSILGSKIYPAIGYSEKDFSLTSSRNTSDKFTIIYAGRAEDWKGLKFLFRVLQRIKIQEINLKLIGIRSLEERFKIENWKRYYKIGCEIEIIDFLPRTDLLNLFGNSNLFVYPAFRDSGSMAILEASVVACPTLCLKVGGQDLLPNDSFLLVKPFESYRKTTEMYAEKLIWAYENRVELSEIGIRAQKYVSENFQWEDKIIYYQEIYKSLLK